jgi:hypothetical protein
LETTEELAFHRRATQERKDNAETPFCYIAQGKQRALRIRREEKRKGDVKLPCTEVAGLRASTCVAEKNWGSLDIPEFGGLRSTQHTDVDAGIFSDQFAGTSASQCRGVDLGGQ